MDNVLLEQQYRDRLHPLYESFTYKLHMLLGELIKKEVISIAQAEYRTKTVESFLGKIRRKNYVEPFLEMKDLSGIRIVTYYHDDVLRVADLIEREFELNREHSLDKSNLLGVDEFGYKSFHLVISLNEPRLSLPEWSPFKNFCAEIQVRSVLQHAWAAISHKLDYKAASQAPLELRRQLFRLSALLELADEQFLLLRNRTQTVVESYKEKIEQGELNIPLNRDSLVEFIRQKVKLKPWYQLGVRAGMMPDRELITIDEKRGELDRLLVTLQALGIATVGEFASLLPQLRIFSKKSLTDFINTVRSYRKEFVPKPVDIITVLVSLKAAGMLPRDFDWNGTFYAPIEKALRKLCGLPPKETKRKKTTRATTRKAGRVAAKKR